MALPILASFTYSPPCTGTSTSSVPFNPSPIMRGRQLAKNLASPDFHDHHDHFTNSTPESEWRSCLEHAEKIGVTVPAAPAEFGVNLGLAVVVLLALTGPGAAAHADVLDGSAEAAADGVWGPATSTPFPSPPPTR